MSPQFLTRVNAGCLTALGFFFASPLAATTVAWKGGSQKEPQLAFDLSGQLSPEQRAMIESGLPAQVAVTVHIRGVGDDDDLFVVSNTCTVHRNVFTDQYSIQVLRFAQESDFDAVLYRCLSLTTEDLPRLEGLLQVGGRAMAEVAVTRIPPKVPKRDDALSLAFAFQKTALQHSSRLEPEATLGKSVAAIPPASASKGKEIEILPLYQ